jgi:hypothetical protein
MVKVTLEGGPRHGDVIEVEWSRQMVTLDWEEESEWKEWDGTAVYVTRIGVATYRRVAADRFEHCVTPMAIGDAPRILKGELP